MKAIKFVLMLITIVMSFSTCIDSEDIIGAIVDPITDENEPEPTPVGFPIGVPTTKIIGSSGGTITDVDGIITVDIPAGALSGDTDITVQPITNFAPNGNGNAYQLGPEGINFNKPITITFKHGNEISSDIPALTGIAFQDIDGIWYSTGKFTWDTAKKTVSTETSHFSGWATFDVLHIIGPGELKVDESGELSVRMINLDATTGKDGDQLIALKKDDNNYKAVIKEWLANGHAAETMGPDGKIVPNDQGAIYTAPAVAPKSSKNPVNVSVTLKDLLYKDPRTGQVFKDLQLFAAIEIIGDFKFNLEVRYKDDQVNPGVDSYITIEDQVSLKVLVKNQLVTTSDITNSMATLVPAVSTFGKCTLTWQQPFEGFAGPISITEATGVVYTVPDGSNEQKILNIVFKCDVEYPVWKFQCPDGTVNLEGAEPSKETFDLDFILKDSTQTITKGLYLATLTPEF